MRAHFVIGLSLVALPSTSFADEAEAAPDPQVLYDDAIRAMDARDYARACPMIESVTQILPDGLGAKFTLAECFEEQGRLGNAYDMFVFVETAAREKGQSERSQKASARADALRPKLARIDVTGLESLASGHDLRVEIDGVAIESAQLSKPRYVDAGMHRIVAFDKGVQRGEQSVDIAAGGVYEVTIQELVGIPERDTTSSTQSTDGSSAPTERSWYLVPPDSEPATKRGFPVWQAAVGGLGLAAIGVGVAFKLDSVAAERKLVEQCGEDLLCPRDTSYHPDVDNARKNRGFGLFLGMTALGAMALGTATVGMIRWRMNKQAPNAGLMVQPTFSPAHGGLIFSGSF